jgi:hypothetical protein
MVDLLTADDFVDLFVAGVIPVDWLIIDVVTEG